MAKKRLGTTALTDLFCLFFSLQLKQNKTKNHNVSVPAARQQVEEQTAINLRNQTTNQDGFPPNNQRPNHEGFAFSSSFSDFTFYDCELGQIS